MYEIKLGIPIFVVNLQIALKSEKPPQRPVQEGFTEIEKTKNNN